MRILNATRVYTSIMTNVTRKYLILYSAILLVPILLISLLVIWYVNQQITTDIVKQNVQSVDTLVKQLDTQINETVLQLSMIADSMEAQNVDLQTMYDRANHMIAASSKIHSVYFITNDRQVLFEAPFFPHLNNVKYEYPNFSMIQWSQHYALSDLTINYAGKSVVSVAVPVFSHNNFTGILVAELNQEYLSELLARGDLNSGAYGTLVDSQGNVIAYAGMQERPPDLTGAHLLSQLSTGKSGYFVGSYAGTRSIVAYEPMNDGWGVIIGVPEKTAFTLVTRLSFALTMGFLVIFVLSLFIIGVGVRKILHPIVRLTHFAKSMDQEESLSELRNMPTSNDELGTLVQSMITMGMNDLENKRILQEKERYLRDVIEGVPYAIVTMDNDGIITHYNKKFQELAGGPVRIEGRPFSDLRKLVQAIPADSLRSAEVFEEREAYVVDSFGDRRIVKVVMSRFFNEIHETIGVIAVLQDISELRVLEEHVKHSEKLAMIGQISSGIAHEIKNPLAILSGASELLKEEIQETESQAAVLELVHDINNVVRRMNSIVNDFLSFARKGQSGMQSVEVSRLVQEVLRLLRVRLTEARVSVVRDFHDAELQINGSPDKLMQVFLNLILNSIDAMHAGGTLTVRVYSELKENNQSIVVEIGDTGVGMPQEQLSHLFEPFYSTKKTGSGLGLTIAMELVKEHNGDMEIKSGLNEGTVVKCIFPLQEPDRKELHV